MTAATDYLEAQILQQYFVTGTAYIALFAADPGEAPTGELAVARKAASFTRTGNRVALASEVSWTNMPAVTVGGVALYDAATGGNALVHGPLTQPDPQDASAVIPASPKAVGAGDTFTLPAGSVAITVD